MLGIALSLLSGLGALIFAFAILFGVIMVGFGESKPGSIAVPISLVLAPAVAILGTVAFSWYHWSDLAYVGLFASVAPLVIFLFDALGKSLGKIQNLRNADIPSAKALAAKVPKGFLIDWLLPPDLAEEALFNILGRYPYWVEKYGNRKARFIFGSQSFRCVVDYWTDWLTRRLKLLTFLQNLN